MAAAASGSKTLRSVLKKISSNAGEEEDSYSITHFEDASRGTRITKIPTHQIYKGTRLSRINFLRGYKIKTLEQSFPLGTKQKDIYFLSRDAIREHRSKYKYLHVGLVQVSVRPLSLGMGRNSNSRVLICLRNAKYPNFEESILAAFESSLDNCIKFNWFPNFSTPLSDLANSNGLVITVEGHDFDLAKGFEDTQILEISYRMCYKLMKSSPKPNSLFDVPVLEVNTEKANIIVPKSINS